ncbi:hypothetical protein BST61_g11276 [Cercospora zeina]
MRQPPQRRDLSSGRHLIQAPPARGQHTSLQQTTTSPPLNRSKDTELSTSDEHDGPENEVEASAQIEIARQEESAMAKDDERSGVQKTSSIEKAPRDFSLRSRSKHAKQDSKFK